VGRIALRGHSHRPAPPDDAKGISRPIGVGYDMGAHEFFEFFEAYLPLVARDW